jgi:aquaporin NIP
MSAIPLRPLRILSPRRLDPLGRARDERRRAPAGRWLSCGSMKRTLAEGLGTFALVFAGTGAIAVDRATGGGVSHVGISLCFGLVVMSMIYAVGDVSGAHLNPAVTVGFFASRRLALREAWPYVVAQCVGAAAASLAVRAIFGAGELGATAPSGSFWQSFWLEVLLTGQLMFVILGVATGAREKGVMAGIAVGGAVALGALVGGPISGGSMNPARSLGPALVGGEFAGLWIYLTAPMLGALAAVGACRCVREPGCCTAAPAEGGDR